MPEICTTKVYREIERGVAMGCTTISEQGSSRSAKTYNTVIWLVMRCLTRPGTTVSVCRATLPSLKGSVLRDFMEVLQRTGADAHGTFNKSDLVFTFSNGSWVEFFSCDNETKLRGRKRKVLFVNEANEIRFIEWQQLKLRTTELAIIDYNPSFSEDHWICGVNRDVRTHHFTTTYRDNPFLEASVIEEIESLRDKNPSLWRIYGLGQQAQVEGLVFPDFTTEPMSPPLLKRRLIGIDFGYSNDPTAIVEVCPDGGVLHVSQIAYSTQMLTSDIIAALQPYRERKIIAESADPRLIREIHNAGFNIHPVRKYPGSVAAGIAKMLEYDIRISEASAEVIREFRNYTWQRNKDGKWTNQPIDGFNHAIDAIRYVVLAELAGNSGRQTDFRRLSSIIH